MSDGEIERGVEGAASFVAERLAREGGESAPVAGFVLGSGIGGLAEAITGAVRIPFTEIPGFPTAHVAGHAGQLVAGKFAGVQVVAMQGRFHLYEGHEPATVALPTRLLVRLGVRILVVTNAAGGLQARLRTGDLMLIDDHINLQGSNPLTGRVVAGEERFPDMSSPYDGELQRIVEATALERRMRIHRGVYCALLGPSYETPAEIRMLQRLGADAVGMSTAPEVIVARASGVRVLGISVITNSVAGPSTAVSHEDVLEAGRNATEALVGLMADAIPRMVAG
jgi:purine-nucleoside phosphorylase